MFGGVKSTGWATILVAGGIALGLSVPAQAADFGGDCCADLEERIAELEATTARKGNRKVKLTVYGKVNQAIGWWDDGNESNIYGYTNDTSRTRFGFKGKAKINKDWFAGYRIEIGVRAPDQGAADADSHNEGPALDVRHSYWTLGSKTYGSINVGETSMAHDGITQFTTARLSHFANPDIIDANDSYDIIQSGGGTISSWDGISQVFEPGEGSRGVLIRYDSPKFSGFSAHAHWGEDDIWGASLKYSGKVGNFKVKGGFGYGEATVNDEECAESVEGADVNGASTGGDCREWGGSLSVMHKPSGLFVTGAGGIREDEGRADVLAQYGFDPSDELTFWHLQAGIEQKWFSLGETTLFGGYQRRDSGHPVLDDPEAGDSFIITFMNGGTDYAVTDARIEMWEAGINQHIKSAAMDLYLHYKYYEADIIGTPVNGDNTPTGGANIAASTEPWQTLIGGAHIKF